MNRRRARTHDPSRTSRLYDLGGRSLPLGSGGHDTVLVGGPRRLRAVDQAVPKRNPRSYSRSSTWPSFMCWPRSGASTKSGCGAFREAIRYLGRHAQASAGQAASAHRPRPGNGRAGPVHRAIRADSSISAGRARRPCGKSSARPCAVSTAILEGIPIKLYPFTRAALDDAPAMVVIDPALSAGRPVIAGTGLATQVIASATAASRYRLGVGRSATIPKSKKRSGGSPEPASQRSTRLASRRDLREIRTQGKSKRRSGVSSRWPPDEPTLFLDRNLGRHIVADRLRSEGMKVEVHDDHLPPDAPDEEWITLVGRKGWGAVTKDKNVRYRAAELASIRRHSARVLVVRTKNATGLDIAALLIAGRRRIARFAQSTTPAPFVAAIYRSGQVKEYERL